MVPNIKYIISAATIVIMDTATTTDPITLITTVTAAIIHKSITKSLIQKMSTVFMAIANFVTTIRSTSRYCFYGKAISLTALIIRNPITRNSS